MEYVWYIVNPHHGYADASAGFSKPMEHMLCYRGSEPSDCSWMIPTWEAFERACDV